eukprot:m.344910 g.344910  ORF g.344910 m.344910 type:complete len:123 (-) comp55803_c0_seq5:553-921(-)
MHVSLGFQAVYICLWVSVCLFPCVLLGMLTAPCIELVIQVLPIHLPFDAVHLLLQLLQRAPSKRITLQAALQHPWFTRLPSIRESVRPGQQSAFAPHSGIRLGCLSSLPCIIITSTNRNGLC